MPMRTQPDCKERKRNTLSPLSWKQAMREEGCRSPNELFLH
ncbi:hypothetical protein GH733_002472 [Mirounga leonina]|nr:hypothetical protein GH733_002472 [Mirounga leonina]